MSETLKEKILSSLNDEISQRLKSTFKSPVFYSDPIQYDYYIVVKANELASYFVRIRDGCFIISYHNNLTNDHTGELERKRYPIEHPNAVASVLQYLDDKCEMKISRTTQSQD